MAWPPTDEDERQAFDEDGAWFLNSYICPECDHEWTDYWSSTCDDDCPSCGLTCSPIESEEIDFND